MRTEPGRGPDAALVSAARDGDPQAVERLVTQSLPLVHNIVGRALDGHGDVDDVVQEALLRVVRGLDRLERPAAYRSWMVAITVRQIRDWIKGRQQDRATRASMERAAYVPDPASDFASLTVLRLQLTDDRREVAEATAWLDGEDRELLALWWLEETGELTRADLAQALGLSGRHTAVRVQRLKEKLDAGRTVVRALAARPPCPGLAKAAAPWDGTPSPLWRKRLARHVRGCERCAARTAELLPVSGLLGGLPLLVPPAALHRAVLEAALPGALDGASRAADGDAGAHTSHGDGGSGHAPWDDSGQPFRDGSGSAHQYEGGHTLRGDDGQVFQDGGGHALWDESLYARGDGSGEGNEDIPGGGDVPGNGGMPGGGDDGHTLQGDTAADGPSHLVTHRAGRAPRAHRHPRGGAPAGAGRLRVLAAAGAAAAVAAGALAVVSDSGTESAAPRAAAAHGPTVSPGATAPSGPAPSASPSASRKVSPSPSATPSRSAASAAPRATAAGAPPAAAPKAVASDRKGVGVWSFPDADAALRQSGAGWYYTWSTAHPGVTTPNGTGFVPMIWGADSVTPQALAEAKAAGPYLLGFNEPDMAGQADMGVEQALSLWPRLESTGSTLGSPAVAYGGDTPGGWLDRFMSGARERGLRVDFITLHWYGGDFRTAAAVEQLRGYLAAVYERYHKPIWLTEFALVDFSQGTPRHPSDEEQAAFLTASTKMLDGLPYLRRYAWFGLGTDEPGPSTVLFRAGPALTPAGRAYLSAR